MSKFGDLVRTKRESMDISQRTLSFMTGVSNAEISRIESGVRKNPSLDTIVKLCSFFEGWSVGEALNAALEDILVDKKVEEEVLFKEKDDKNEKFDPGDVLGLYSTAYIFNVSQETLRCWIRNGDMNVTEVDCPEGTKEYAITNDDIKDFVKRHPMYFTKAIQAGIYDGDIKDISDPEEKEELKSRFELTIWSGQEDYGVIVKCHQYVDSGPRLTAFDKEGKTIAVFNFDNIFGYEIKRNED